MSGVSPNPVEIIDKIKSTFEEKNQFLVVIHKNADADAVGSALALKYYLQSKGKETIIGCESINSQGKMLLENLEEEVEYHVPPGDHDTVVLLDTSSVEKAGIFKECVYAAENVVVIDHHEKNKELEQFLYYNEHLASNAEIIYKFFPLSNENYLKAILAGIVADTGHFKHATPATFETVHTILTNGIDLQEIFLLLQTEMDRSRKIAVLKACKRMKLHYIKDLIIATTSVGSHESLAAKYLLFMGADISFVANKDRISSRAKKNVIKRGINLAEIMQKIGTLENGDGGGHKAAAGAASLEDTKNALNLCVKLVEKRLDTHG